MKKIIVIIIAILNLQFIYAQKNIEVTYKKKKDKSVDFSFKKKLPGSYYLVIEFTKLENCNQSTIFKKVVKHSSGHLFTLKPANENKGISFSYRRKYSFGDPKPKVNNDIIYALPFKEDKSVKIIEASNAGEKYFGSEKPAAWKSFIQYSKETDTVYAMRKGIVVKIKNEYVNDDEVEKTFTSKRNRILVEHEDGTYAAYKGFDKNEMFVKLGQKIYPHTPLGKTEKFSKDNYRLDFSVFHYVKKTQEDKKSTLKNRNHRIKYLDPNFFVDNQNKKIKSGEFYKASFNEEIKVQEFSKREKKKYKKTPNNFK